MGLVSGEMNHTDTPFLSTELAADIFADPPRQPVDLLAVAEKV